MARVPQAKLPSHHFAFAVEEELAVPMPHRSAVASSASDQAAIVALLSDRAIHMDGGVHSLEEPPPHCQPAQGEHVYH